MQRIPGIRLIASDFDGTLAHRGKIDPVLGAEIAAAIENERTFAIVTGRPLDNLLEALDLCGLPRNAFPQAVVCEERDVHIRRDGGYTPWKEHNEAALTLELGLLKHSRAVAHELRRDWPAAIVGVDAWTDVELSPFEQSSAENEYGRGYVELRFANPRVARVVQALCQKRVSDVTDMMVVRNGRLVTFRHAAFGKGRVLDLLRRHLGLQAHEVMAVGDSGNDISMLNSDYGFWSAAVGNADEEVKQAVAANHGVLLEGVAYDGIRELLEICMWSGANRSMAMCPQNATRLTGEG